MLYHTIIKGSSNGFKMTHTSSDIVTHEISWKTVFNSNVADRYIWTTIDAAAQAAMDCGYKYYSWNGKVYSVEEGEIDITTKQLDDEIYND